MPHHESRVARFFRRLFSIFTLSERLHDMTQASDRATASVANLASKVDALIAANTASNQDPAFTAIADQADAEAAKVDAALNPG